MLIETIALETGLSKDQLIKFAEKASKKYYTFLIDKRTGGKREISHPAKPLKSLQRWLNSRVLSSWDTHHCATAYKHGSSIRSNAVRHSATNFTLRVDFSDFFPSFNREGIKKYFEDNRNISSEFTNEDLDFFCDIVLRHDCLTIGAPTSPYITNALMYDFDMTVAAYCERQNLIYTRYADDIFVSSVEPNALGEIYQYIRKQAEHFPYADLSINQKKTRFLSRKNRRVITGLTITSDRKVSLGRDRKREIKSLLHRFSQGDLDDEKISYLKGLLAFSSDVERTFVESLKAKYGKKLLRSLGDA